MVALVFDLDETLIDKYRHVFSGVEKMLHLLKKEGYDLYVVSYNSSAKGILERRNLLNIFKGGWVPKGNYIAKKSYMIKQLGLQYNFNPHRAILFDDLASNIKDCHDAGIPAVHIDPAKGVKIGDVRKAIRKYFPNH